MGVCQTILIVRKEHCYGYEYAERLWTGGHGSRTLSGKKKQLTMFLHYYVDTRSHHKHAVHHEGCPSMPGLEHMQYLGMFEACSQAVTMARIVYLPATACQSCARIHKRPSAPMLR